MVSKEMRELILTLDDILKKSSLPISLWTVEKANQAIENVFKKRLEACQGTAKDILDGKPLPPDWQDGTDAACDGWWRGQEDGVRGAAFAIEKAFDGPLKGMNASRDIDRVQHRIRNLILELDRRGGGKV